MIRVSIADAQVGRDSDQIYTVVGSCIAVMLYDMKSRTGGMLHLMLDYHKGRQDNPCKYADSGIPYLIEQMVGRGARRGHLQGAKIAGGALMLQLGGEQNVARSNHAAVLQVLKTLGIQIIATDCGGSYSRRITFDTASGKVLVESQQGARKIL